MSFSYTKEESSLINTVENYNHCLAGIGSHGSSLTLDKIGKYFWVRKCKSRVPMVRVHANKELSSMS